MKFLTLIPVLIFSASCPIKVSNPIPTPTPIDPPISEPVDPPVNPTPTQCTFPQGIPEQDYKLVPNPGKFSTIVDQTIRENTNCTGETDCTWGSENPQFYLRIMINALQQKGLCAGQHEDGVTDQISVAENCNAETTWENYQPVNFGGTQHKARFAPGNIKDGWQVPKSCNLNQKPPLDPPFEPACGDPPRPPCNPPEPQLNCNPHTGFRDIKVLTHVGNRLNINTTPEGCNKDKCNELGWTGRNCCPLGRRGDEQVKCENELVGSAIFTLLTQVPNNSVISLETNPTSPFLGIMRINSNFQVAKIRVCGEKTPAVCTEAIIQ